MEKLKSVIQLIGRDKKKSDKEYDPKEDPALKYFQFLRKLKINFATKSLTTSKITKLEDKNDQ